MSQGWRAPDTVLVTPLSTERTDQCLLLGGVSESLLVAGVLHPTRTVFPSPALTGKRHQALSAQRLLLYILVGEAVHDIYA